MKSTQVIQHFDYDHAPCTCATHNHIGIVCTTVKVYKRALDGRNLYRCINCNMTWDYEPAPER